MVQGTDILSLPTTVGGLSGTEWVPIVQGGTTKRTQVVNLVLGGITEIFPASVVYVMSGGDFLVPTGVNGSGITVPFDCTIVASVLNGNLPSGDIVVDVWKCTEDDFDGGLTHPVVGDSITGGNPPTIAAGSKDVDVSLTGWTTELLEGDVLWYNVSGVTSFTCVTLVLIVSRDIT